MATLLADELVEMKNAVTHKQPAMVVANFTGEPLYVIACQGQQSSDEIWWNGSGGTFSSISGTKTDAAPALALLQVYPTATIYLAWKVAGSNSIKVMQKVLGEDGLPTGNNWESLPIAGTLPAGFTSEPAASTDAAPALAVGANGQLYLVWKTPGTATAMAWSEYHGSGWSPPKTIPQALTTLNPALLAWYTSGLAGTSVPPLFLAWRDSATGGVFWAEFTPGSTALTPHAVSGAVTDAAPALAPGTLGKSSYLVWKQKGSNALSMALVNATSAGPTFTLPQVTTQEGPAAGIWLDPSETPATTSLILAWSGKTKGDLWMGYWNILANPALNTGLGSNFNYVFSDNRNALKDVSVTIKITQDIVSSNGFGFQLNAYSPATSKDVNWQQYFISFQPTSGANPKLNVYSYINNWQAPSTKKVLIYASPEFATLPTNKLPAGYTVKIDLTSDPKNNNNVTSVLFSLADNEGNPPKTSPINLLKLDVSGTTSLVQEADLAPIVAFELNFVGAINTETAVLTSGAGEIMYTSSTSMTPATSEPSWATPANWGTAEKANSLYGVVSAKAGTSFTQLFCATVPLAG